LCQRRGVDHVIKAAVHQADESDETIGDHFRYQFLAEFGLLAAKGDLGLTADGGQHVQKLAVQRANAQLFGMCDHGATFQ